MSHSSGNYLTPEAMGNQQAIPFGQPSLEEIIDRDAREVTLKAVCRDAHRAIHDATVKTVVLNGIECNIYWSGNGCRAVVYKDITFMEQNKNKDSLSAQQAREGKRITWGLRFGTWIYIDDETVRI